MGGIFINFEPLTSGIGLTGFMSANNCLALSNKSYENNTTHTLTSPIYFNNCTFVSFINYGFTTYGIGLSSHIFNNTMIYSSEYAFINWNYNSSNSAIFNNCRFSGGSQILGNNTRTNSTYGLPGLDFGEQLLFGLSHTQFLSSKNNGYLVGAGTSAGIGSSDLFGYGWQGVAPDIGAIQYRSLNSVSSFIPQDRQFESITIAPDSTSQSIYIYVIPSGASETGYGLIAYNLTVPAYNSYETFRFGVNPTDVIKVAGPSGMAFYVQGIDQTN
jgi:hypothetical protein